MGAYLKNNLKLNYFYYYYLLLFFYLIEGGPFLWIIIININRETYIYGVPSCGPYRILYSFGGASGPAQPTETHILLAFFFFFF